MQALKDQFFSKAYVTTLASDVKHAAADFDTKDFVRRVLDRSWKARELKDRMHHVADSLHARRSVATTEACIKLLTPIVQRRIQRKHPFIRRHDFSRLRRALWC
jgi:hypothetical protein